MAGIEDILAGKAVQEILKNVAMFKDTVLGPSDTYASNETPANTFAVSLLPVPPNTGDHNMVELVEELNEGYRNINREAAQRFNVHHAPSLIKVGRQCRDGRYMPAREDHWNGSTMIPKDTRSIIKLIDGYFNSIYTKDTGRRGEAVMDDEKLEQAFRENREKEELRNNLPKPLQFPEYQQQQQYQQEPTTYAEHRRRKAEQSNQPEPLLFPDYPLQKPGTRTEERKRRAAGFREATMCLGPVDGKNHKKMRTEVQTDYTTEQLRKLGSQDISSSKLELYQPPQLAIDSDENRMRQPPPSFREQLRTYVTNKKTQKGSYTTTSNSKDD